MPHAARRISESGYYHVVPKGIGDRIIFENDDDRTYYRRLLKAAKSFAGCLLLAYCLMSNHVHLVVEALHGDALAAYMKYIDERYATYFARKTGQPGGILRRPFWSEPIKAEGHLLSAVRYVHANPAAAGICPASAYEWSSAKDYLGRPGIADTSMVLDLCGGLEGFVQLSRQMPGCARPFSTSKLKGHLTDDEVLRIAQLTIGENTLRSIGSLPPEHRDKCLRELKATGLTIRQIQRITGLGYYIIQHA